MRRLRTRALAAALAGLPLMASGFAVATGGPDAEAYRRDIEAWRSSRIARLTSATGWLTVVGLFWLEPGKNPVGSDPGNRVALPAGKTAPYLGSIDLEGAETTFHAAPGAPVVVSTGGPVANLPLQSDADGDPTVLTAGPVSFFVIKRGERFGVRVRDSESDARRHFHGIPFFSVDPRWRVTARFEPYDPPRKIAVPTILGTTDVESSPGALAFEIEGETYRLDPVLEQGTTDWFLIFGDRTNGADTYGAGRFVYAPPPKDGKTIIDFNKAYNPPCAFTPYATCPLPPPQNRLALRVEAGEKKYGGH